MTSRAHKMGANITPQLIQLRDAPSYLGGQNRFNKEVCPALTEIPIGRQGAKAEEHLAKRMEEIRGAQLHFMRPGLHVPYGGDEVFEGEPNGRLAMTQTGWSSWIRSLAR